MQIKELRWRGLLVWPPQWTEESPDVLQQGLLKGVKLLPLTDLIRIDATYAKNTVSGLILTNAEYQGSLYDKLKENIGKPLNEVGNVEVTF
jgi:hypothetical protein